MGAVRKILELLILVSLAFAFTACSKKNGKTANLRDRRTALVSPSGNPNFPGGNMFPGGSPYNQSCPNCGYFFNSAYSNWSPLLADFLFLQDPSELVYVSGRQGDTTGVFFQGQVDPQAFTGQIRVVVWDQAASLEGPFVASMNLEPNPQSYIREDGSPFRLVFKDDLGTLVMEGAFTNRGTYEGQVSFTNRGGQLVNLGQFITGACSFVTGC